MFASNTRTRRLPSTLLWIIFLLIPNMAYSQSCIEVFKTKPKKSPSEKTVSHLGDDAIITALGWLGRFNPKIHRLVLSGIQRESSNLSESQALEIAQTIQFIGSVDANFLKKMGLDVRSNDDRALVAAALFLIETAPSQFTLSSRDIKLSIDLQKHPACAQALKRYREGEASEGQKKLIQIVHQIDTYLETLGLKQKAKESLLRYLEQMVGTDFENPTQHPPSSDRDFLIQRGVSPEMADFAIPFYQNAHRASELRKASRSEEYARAKSDQRDWAAHDVSHVLDIVHQFEGVFTAFEEGGVIAKRKRQSRRAFLLNYGPNMVAMHDIGNGMDGFSGAARKLHPQFAAKVIMRKSFDQTFNALWNGKAGELFCKAYGFTRNAKTKLWFREMLTASLLHSKSRIPSEDMSDPATLRKRLIEVVLLLEAPEAHYLEKGKLEPLEQELDNTTDPTRKKIIERKIESVKKLMKDEQRRHDEEMDRHYSGLFGEQAFSWLVEGAKFREDMYKDFTDIGGVVLAAADVLRSRGSELLDTSGAPFVLDPRTGNLITYKNDARTGRILPASMVPMGLGHGEANTLFSKIVFNRETREVELVAGLVNGRFGSSEVTEQMIQATAEAMLEKIGDTVHRSAAGKDIRFVLHRPADEGSSQFTQKVIDQTLELSKQKYQDRTFRYEIREALPVKINLLAGLREQRLYERRGAPASGREGRGTLEALAESGFPVQKISDPEGAFLNARIIHLESGDQLVHMNAPGNYVYIVLNGTFSGENRMGVRFRQHSGSIVGHFASIRNIPTGRNANLFAEVASEAVVIPAEDYLKHFSNAFYERREVIDLIRR